MSPFNYWVPNRISLIQDVEQEKKKLQELQQPSLLQRALQFTPWGAISAIPQMMGMAQKGLYGATEPFRQWGMLGTRGLGIIGTTPEEKELFGQRVQGAFESNKQYLERMEREGLEPMRGQFAVPSATELKKAPSQIAGWLGEQLPGAEGTIRQEYEALPLHTKLLAELPAYMAAGAAIGAIPIKGVPISQWEAKGMSWLWGKTIGPRWARFNLARRMKLWQASDEYQGFQSGWRKHYGTNMPADFEKDVFGIWDLWKSGDPAKQQAAEGAWRTVYGNLTKGMYGKPPQPGVVSPRGAIPAWAGGTAGQRALLPAGKTALPEVPMGIPGGTVSMAVAGARASIASAAQKIEAHRIAYTKAMIDPKTKKVTPQYRRLAEVYTGQKSMMDMTFEEANTFVEALKRLPEATLKRGKWVPPSVPKTTKVTPENFFGIKFGEPTPIRLFTSQTYYSQVLGLKPLVEPLELARQRFDLEYQALSRAVEGKIGEINRVGGVSAIEQLKAKRAGEPTKAVEAMRNLLDKYENPPPELDPKGAKLFIWFRNLNRTLLSGENQVRALLGMEPIPYRQAYVRHVADQTATEILLGRQELPEGLKYWSREIVGKRIYNPMELHRKLTDDLAKYFTKDLGYATKSMLWTGLKEIHLSQPLKAFREQYMALTKDMPEYKNLTAGEQAQLREINLMPASTRKWLTNYVNQVIKGQQTGVDEEINRIATKSGLGGLLNKAVKPFGVLLGQRPFTRLAQATGRLIISATIGPRPRLIIRNLFQHTQNLALYGITPTLKAMMPAPPLCKELMNESLFLKGYTGFEELPINLQGKLEKIWLHPYGRSAIFNAKQAMKASYHDTLDLIQNPKHKGLGWADPRRTHTEPKNFLYPSERKKLLYEMEFGAGITQYSYIGMGMPEIFRHKTLIPLTRLQSWWMNHFTKFHREAFHRLVRGETMYGAKLPWSRRINYLKYLILGGALLTSLGYKRSFLLGVLPHYMSPGMQIAIGLYNYVSASSDWQRTQAKRQIYFSWKAFVPGSLAWQDFNAVWKGDKPLSSLLFYTEEWPPQKPTWGIPPLEEKEAEGGLPERQPLPGREALPERTPLPVR